MKSHIYIQSRARSCTNDRRTAFPCDSLCSFCRKCSCISILQRFWTTSRSTSVCFLNRRYYSADHVVCDILSARLELEKCICSSHRIVLRIIRRSIVRIRSGILTHDVLRRPVVRFRCALRAAAALRPAGNSAVLVLSGPRFPGAGTGQLLVIPVLVDLLQPDPRRAPFPDVVETGLAVRFCATDRCLCSERRLVGGCVCV